MPNISWYKLDFPKSSFTTWSPCPNEKQKRVRQVVRKEATFLCA